MSYSPERSTDYNKKPTTIKQAMDEYELVIATKLERYFAIFFFSRSARTKLLSVIVYFGIYLPQISMHACVCICGLACYYCICDFVVVSVVFVAVFIFFNVVSALPEDRNTLARGMGY